MHGQAQFDPAGSPGEKESRVSRSRTLFDRFRIFVLLFYITWCGVLYFFQDDLLFPRDLAPSPTPRLYNAATTQLERVVPDVGRIAAWFVPAPALGETKTTPLVIYFHGNAEIIDYQDTMIQGYHKLGVSVLLPEYRGYGRSAGIPSEDGIVSDAVYFYDQVIARPDVDASRVVFHGRSVGGGPAARLAAERKPNALILESTFTSAASMAHKYFAPAFLVKNPFNVDRVVESLDVPILIFHGHYDSIIPVWHGRALRDLARQGSYVEFDCDHNDFPGVDNDEKYWGRIGQFLQDTGIVTMPAEWKMTPEPTTATALEENSPRASAWPARFARKVVVTAATIYVGYVGFMFLFQDAVVFPPLPTASAGDFPRETDRMVIDVPQGGQVEAWFTPAPKASAEMPAPVVVFFHGQLELIDYHAATVERFRRMGCSVLLPEYRGSGRSTAALDEGGLLDDAIEEYDVIVARPDVDRSRIAFVGRSLGGAPAVALATKRPPRAMVLEATFANFPDLAAHFLVPPFLARFTFPTEQRLAGLDMPVLIAHGLYDWTVPISHGHRLRDAAQQATFIEYPTGHVGFVHDESYWRDVASFLKTVGVIDKGPA